MRQAPLLPNRMHFTFERFHEVSFWVRLKILLGWNPVTKAEVFMDRRNAEVKTGITLLISKCSSEEDYQREQDRAGEK